MKRAIIKTSILFASILLLSFALVAEWKITDQYHIDFSTSGVNGTFKKFDGTVLFDEHDIAASKFDVTIDVESISTGNKLKNKHAKSNHWFDAETYPTIKFISKTITKSDSAYEVVGDLQMHGITKEISIPFTFKNNDTEGIFSGNFTVNRNDFGIGKPGGVVGDIIKLNVSVPVRKH